MEDGRYVERARRAKQQDDADEQADVPDPCRDKGLLRRLRSRSPFPPEPYEQIRAQSHKLPRNVEENQVVRQNERKHRPGEQGVDCVVPADAALAPHVLERVHLNEECDEGYEAEHRNRQPVDDDAPRYPRVAQNDPVDSDRASAVSGEVGEHEPEEDEPDCNCRNRNVDALPWEEPPQDGGQEERRDAQRRDNPSPLRGYGVGQRHPKGEVPSIRPPSLRREFPYTPVRYCEANSILSVICLALRYSAEETTFRSLSKK